jgi:hypothetical protein
MEFTGLPSEQQVCYRVIAFNRVGDSPPTSTRCTITLATPTDLIATGFDAQTIDLTWKDNSVVEDGYEVWLVDEAFGFLSNAIAYLPAGSTSYRYTDVDAYLYGYAVVASKGGFYSAFSNYTYPPTPGSSSAAARSVQTTARPRVRRP